MSRAGQRLRERVRALQLQRLEGLEAGPEIVLWPLCRTRMPTPTDISTVSIMAFAWCFLPGSRIELPIGSHIRSHTNRTVDRTEDCAKQVRDVQFLYQMCAQMCN